MNIPRSAQELRAAADKYRTLARQVGDSDTERRVKKLVEDLERQARNFEED